MSKEINFYFSGYAEVFAKDVKIKYIKGNVLDISELSVDELENKFNEGEVFMSLDECLQHAHNDNFEISWVEVKETQKI